jgi:hypothetical protein
MVVFSPYGSPLVNFARDVRSYDETVIKTNFSIDDMQILKPGHTGDGN